MDPSALIFVALAVAWALYLIPKALEHHDASDRTRTIDRFSHGLRVLGRREPVDRRSARLVKTTAPAKASAPVAAPAPAPAPAPAAASAPAPVRPAAAGAARRRRNVLAAILLVLVAAAVCAGLGIVPVYAVGVPVVVLVAWLVACRLMVRKEQAAVPVRRAPAAPAAAPVEEPADEDDDATREVPVVTDEIEDDETTDSAVGRWDPVDVPLPTYVSKPAAARTVRTIDLDSTGVWSSGRNEADSALAREADAARGTGAESTQPVRRRTGS